MPYFFNNTEPFEINDNQSDVEFALNQCYRTLASNKKGGELAQSIMVRYYIHLIGDIH